MRELQDMGVCQPEVLEARRAELEEAIKSIG
jgi:hypothetical protein